MKRQKVLTEKVANAKIVFKGVVVEIKKVSDQEVELTLPENVDTKELLNYLESFGVLKRKVVIPHSEPQPEVQTEENVPVQQEEQEKENNVEEEVKKEDSTETKTTDTEEPSQAEDTTTTKKRTRKSKSN
jgi:hypothetical protein